MDIPVVTFPHGQGRHALLQQAQPSAPGYMHGSKYANMAVTECDLLIAVGALLGPRDRQGL